MRVGAVEHRIEARQARVGVDRARVVELRRNCCRQSRVFPKLLVLQHQRAKPVFAQHGGIGGQRLDNAARLEEIGRVEAFGDAVLHIDAAEIEIALRGRLPARIGLAQIVADVLMRWNRQRVLGAQIHPSAIGEAQRVAEPPILARVEEEALFPIRRARRRRRHQQGAMRGDGESILDIETLAGAGGRSARLWRCRRRCARYQIEIAVLVGTGGRCRERRQRERREQQRAGGGAFHSTVSRGR